MINVTGEPAVVWNILQLIGTVSGILALLLATIVFFVQEQWRSKKPAARQYPREVRLEVHSAKVPSGRRIVEFNSSRSSMSGTFEHYARSVNNAVPHEYRLEVIRYPLTMVRYANVQRANQKIFRWLFVGGLVLVTFIQIVTGIGIENLTVVALALLAGLPAMTLIWLLCRRAEARAQQAIDVGTAYVRTLKRNGIRVDTEFTQLHEHPDEFIIEPVVNVRPEQLEKEFAIKVGR